MNPDPLRYAGFWPRLGSILLDGLFWMPFVFLSSWGEHFRLYELYTLVPWLMLQLFWSVYLVRRFGGTPGKLIMKIRIRKVNGEPVGYREAVLRCLPDQILGLLMSIATIQAAMGMTDLQFMAIAPADRTLRSADMQPLWSVALFWVNQIWAWGELLVLLTNRKRRALHDFIAGTVVVYANSIPKTEPTTDDPGLLTVHDF